MNYVTPSQSEPKTPTLAAVPATTPNFGDRLFILPGVGLEQLAHADITEQLTTLLVKSHTSSEHGGPLMVRAFLVQYLTSGG